MYYERKSVQSLHLQMEYFPAYMISCFYIFIGEFHVQKEYVDWLTAIKDTLLFTCFSVAPSLLPLKHEQQVIHLLSAEVPYFKKFGDCDLFWSVAELHAMSAVHVLVDGTPWMSGTDCPPSTGLVMKLMDDWECKTSISKLFENPSHYPRSNYTKRCGLNSGYFFYRMCMWS